MRIVFSVERSRGSLQLLLVVGSAEPLAVLVDVVEHGSDGPEDLWVEDAQDVDNGVVHFPDHDFEACIPALYVPFHKHDFRLWVSFDEFFGEANGGCVRYGPISAQQIIPLIWGELRTAAVIFSLESANPFVAVVDVVKRCVSVISGLATKNF